MICSKCSTNPTSNGHRYCTECRAIYDKAYYEANRQKIYARKIERRKEHTKFIRDLKTNPCMDCGGTFHPVAMQWDHREDEVKFRDVSELALWGKTTILREVEKCDLVCANCHAVRTYNRRECNGL